MLFWVQDVDNSCSIVLGGHCEDMQLIEFGDFLEKLAHIWTQAAVVDNRVPWQAELMHILHVHEEVEQIKTLVWWMKNVHM